MEDNMESPQVPKNRLNHPKRNQNARALSVPGPIVRILNQPKHPPLTPGERKCATYTPQILFGHIKEILSFATKWV